LTLFCHKKHFKLSKNGFKLKKNNECPRRAENSMPFSVYVISPEKLKQILMIMTRITEKRAK
jgi:hypothetical protein